MKITIEAETLQDIQEGLGLEPKSEFVLSPTPFLPRSAEIVELQNRHADALALISRCAPFIYRARFPSKTPHEQDKIDAEALWPEVRAYMAISEADAKREIHDLANEVIEQAEGQPKPDTVEVPPAVAAVIEQINTDVAEPDEEREAIQHVEENEEIIAGIPNEVWQSKRAYDLAAHLIEAHGIDDDRVVSIGLQCKDASAALRNVKNPERRLRTAIATVRGEA